MKLLIAMETKARLAKTIEFLTTMDMASFRNTTMEEDTTKRGAAGDSTMTWAIYWLGRKALIWVRERTALFFNTRIA
jgi:hypothetical protein